MLFTPFSLAEILTAAAKLKALVHTPLCRFGLKRGINIFSTQVGTLGLLKTWIMLEDLYEAMFVYGFFLPFLMT